MDSSGDIWKLDSEPRRTSGKKLIFQLPFLSVVQFGLGNETNICRHKRGADPRHGQLHHRGQSLGRWDQAGTDRLHRRNAVRTRRMGGSGS